MSTNNLVDCRELRTALEREEAIAKRTLGKERDSLATAFFEVVYRALDNASAVADRHVVRVAIEAEESRAKDLLGKKHDPLVTMFFEIIYRTLNKMPFPASPAEVK